VVGNCTSIGTSSQLTFTGKANTWRRIRIEDYVVSINQPQEEKRMKKGNTVISDVKFLAFLSV